MSYLHVKNCFGERSENQVETSLRQVVGQGRGACKSSNDFLSVVADILDWTRQDVSDDERLQHSATDSPAECRQSQQRYTSDLQNQHQNKDNKNVFHQQNRRI